MTETDEICSCDSFKKSGIFLYTVENNPIRLPPTKDINIFNTKNSTIRSKAAVSSLLFATLPSFLASFNFFSVVPLGGAQFQFDNMLSTMTKYMGDMFVIGFRIFLPVFACMMIMNCILGIMAKVAPQMNMFSVGIQLKIIAGFIVLFLIVYLIPNIANFIITEIKTMVVSIIDGMY